MALPSTLLLPVVSPSQRKTECWQISAAGSFGQLSFQPWNRAGCGCRTLPFAAHGLEGHKCPLRGPGAGQAGSGYGLLAKAASQGRKSNHGSPFRFPCAMAPRSHSSANAKGRVWVCSFPAGGVASQHDQQLPVSQAGARPARQGLPNHSSSQLPSPRTILGLRKLETALDVAIMAITTAMMEVQPIGMSLPSFKYQQPQTASHAPPEEASSSS